MTSTDRPTAPSPETLEPVIAAVEARLAGLAQALLEREQQGVERAAQRGGVPPALRQQRRGGARLNPY